MNTIGESAAQGAAGIILWGSLNYSNSKVSAVVGTVPLPSENPHSLTNRTVTSYAVAGDVPEAEGLCGRATGPLHRQCDSQH